MAVTEQKFSPYIARAKGFVELLSEDFQKQQAVDATGIVSFTIEDKVAPRILATRIPKAATYE